MLVTTTTECKVCGKPITKGEIEEHYVVHHVRSGPNTAELRKQLVDIRKLVVSLDDVLMNVAHAVSKLDTATLALTEQLRTSNRTNDQSR